MTEYLRDAEGRVLHAHLTDGSGALIAFLRMTEEACPACHRPHGGCLGVMFETQHSETVHCQRCDYQFSRPRKDPPGRRMNQGRG